ncbi:glycosyltransferase family 2 protein [Mycolicibacterium sp. YH-1]|uniref:glycosyltransferase family 2 protein n=1 Tax=Mycolicibacterium sp. YH-1 TaxID=2908837 RepID=UPI001F4BEB28|nr:galactosyltransferase-related protein [Mycolicibacterium sp. YH-1]UNB52660.1 glycosyltransferase family 2 protein [Mycolicibacterium sp. YH-1]
MKTAVITVVHGRAGYLRNQLRGIQASRRTPEQHVIVAVDDPTVIDTVTDCGAIATVVPYRASGPHLPVADARNVGARSALDGGAELLIFLDVDCIPAATAIGRYHQVAAQRAHRDALLCGMVTYLPPCGADGYDIADLDSHADPHPARPTPPDGIVSTSATYELFWSLSFAVSATTWRRIGGFWPGYLGYGAEDTDFGQLAAAKRVPLRWIGGAHVFHQHHPVSDPPVEHLADIVRNATLFHQRWGWWPMTGWLDQFENLALICRDQQGRPHLTADGPVANPPIVREHEHSRSAASQAFADWYRNYL